jgi:hypothetical protein
MKKRAEYSLRSKEGILLSEPPKTVCTKNDRPAPRDARVFSGGFQKQMKAWHVT